MLPAKFLDYQGRKCGGLMIMSRDDGFLFEAQGAIANTAFQTMKGVEFHGNVTRLDAQVTVKGTEENCPQPERVFDNLRRHQTQSATFRGVNLSLERPAKTGHTCGVGSRNSGSYVRVYDAGAVHSDRYPPGAVRWELEGKGDNARSMYGQLQSAASVPCCATSLVMGRLMAWGIRQEWFTSQPPIYPLSGYKKTDDEQKLQWVEDYWVGTFLHLMQRGYADVLAEKLHVKKLEMRDDFFPTPSTGPKISGGYNIGVISGWRSE